MLLFALFLLPGIILVRGSGAKVVSHSVLLLLVVELPAQGLGSARDVWRRWRALGQWTLWGTLLWDLWTAGIGMRLFLSEWPLVYGSSLGGVLCAISRAWRVGKWA